MSRQTRASAYPTGVYKSANWSGARDSWYYIGRAGVEIHAQLIDEHITVFLNWRQMESIMRYRIAARAAEEER